MSVRGLTIKLLDGVTYNNPNIGELKDGSPSGVMLKQGGTTVIPYNQVKQIQSDLERGKIVIVGLIDDEMGSVGVPSKMEEGEKVTGPAAAKKELEFEIKNNIKSEPDSLVKIKEDRFNPESKDKFIEVKDGETHEESQARMRDEMGQKNHQDMKDEIAQVAKKKASEGPTKKIEGRNAAQELKDEIKPNSVNTESSENEGSSEETTETKAPAENTQTDNTSDGDVPVKDASTDGVSEGTEKKEAVGAAEGDNVGW